MALAVGSKYDGSLMVENEYAREIAERLRAAITSLIEIASRHDITELPKIPYQVEWMEQQGDGRSIGRAEAILEPSYAPWHFEHRVEIEECTSMQALQSAAASLLEKGATLPAAMPFGDRLGYSLVSEYFEHVGAFRLNEVVLKRVCEEFMIDLFGEKAIAHAIFRVRQFACEAPFQLGGDISFFPITKEHIRKYGRTNDVFGMPSGMPTLPFGARLASDDWLCSIEKPVRKDDLSEFNQLEKNVEDVALALALASTGRASFLLLDKSINSPFLQIGRIFGGPDVLTRRAGATTHLTPDAVARTLQILALVRQVQIDTKCEYLRLPMRRLRTSSTRREAEDHFVDCIVGLERLLAPDSDRLETTFRFRLRGAALLPNEYGTARERAKLMSDLYKTRSVVVHGSVSSEDISDKCEKAENILREILLWYMTNGAAIGQHDTVIRAIDDALIDGGASLRT